MSGNVFEIEGLECAYVHRSRLEKNVVLCIDKLDIPAGKVTVILGMSGSGKSTLIETLGLMNNTIEKGIVRYNSGGKQTLIDRAIWKRPSVLTRIRNRHFSFIFQNDFLMPYYNTVENMLIGALIQDTTASDPQKNEEAMNSFCRKMGLDFKEISGKKTFELSVGQKQRISFIRAIAKDFSVIFGDEPTGNLDEVNAWLLMDVLKEEIGRNRERSAILVSHNIPLSVEKADKIIVLSRRTSETYGVSAGSVYTRAPGGWLNSNNDILNNDILSSEIRKAVGREAFHLERGPGYA